MTAADPFSPATLGPITLRNRTIKAATFEGRSRRQLVTDELIAFHRAVAAGGVGMTTVAYCAVSPDGCPAPGVIVLRDEAVPGLRRLTDAVHAEGAAVAVQIGHAGPVAGAGQRGLAPSRLFSPVAMRMMRAATEDDIERITGDFARGARLAVDSGVDAVEIHLGHNYLLSSFLSPKLNRRRDRWGGSVENRARFPQQVVRTVRDAVGDRAAITAKLNMDDGVPGGLGLDDAIAVAQLLESDGALDAIELTGGSSLANPMYLFRGDIPTAELAANMPPLVRMGFRLFGGRFMKSYPFEEAYWLPQAKQVRAAVKMPLILLGGITRVETMRTALDEGFGFVAMARALLREPDLVNRMQSDTSVTATCTHCNRCMPSIYSGTRCVLDSPDPAWLADV